MARISLSDGQRQELEYLARQGRDAQMVRRAQGLLWLNQGELPMAVAQRLGVTRESVYAWLRHLGAGSLAEKLLKQSQNSTLNYRPDGGISFK